MNKIVGLILIGMVAFAGCSKVPTVEVDNVEAAVNALVLAGAAEYAPEELAGVNNSLSQAKAEVVVQQDKFVLFRSYKNLKVMLLETKKLADEALVTTEANKAAAKVAAETAISNAKTSLLEAKRLILLAPRGKGSDLDVAMLQADLAGIEQMLVEVDSVFVSGKYNEALTKATASMNSSNTIVADVNAAIDAKLK